MMFLDCPAYLDQDGAQRCGLPAEVRSRFVLRSSDGPVEAAMIRCPSGHWFNGPIESLTWESEKEHHPGQAGAASSATRRLREGPDDGSLDRPTANSPMARADIIACDTPPDGRDGNIVRYHPEEPQQEISRPNSAPAYYLGRPARLWLAAMGPRCKRKPLADANSPIGEDQPPEPRSRAVPGPGLALAAPGGSVGSVRPSV